VQQLCHPSALRGQKTADFLVAAPVFEIDLLIRYGRNVSFAHDRRIVRFEAVDRGIPVAPPSLS